MLNILKNLGETTIVSVTARIKQVKQPKGEYIKPSQFQEITYDDGITLEEENLHTSVIGMTVDYLTRYMISANLKDAFKISISGYQNGLLAKNKHQIIYKFKDAIYEFFVCQLRLYYL